MKRIILKPFQYLSKKMSRKNMYQWLYGHEDFIRDKHVLNIGAAGPIPDIVRSLDCKEFNNLDIAPDKDPDIVADICNVGSIIPDNTYDTVVMMEVLEHIPTPDKALSEIHRILKPGGALIGSTPFIFPIHAAPHDYYRFTYYGLKHLLQNFKQVEIHSRNNFGEAIGVLLVRALRFSSLKSALFGFIGFTLGLLLYFPLKLLSLFWDDLGTTGYTWIGRKG